MTLRQHSYKGDHFFRRTYISGPLESESYHDHLQRTLFENNGINNFPKTYSAYLHAAETYKTITEIGLHIIGLVTPRLKQYGMNVCLIFIRYTLPLPVGRR